MAELKDLEGYEEMLSRFLASMSPEQRLAGLAPGQAILALPDLALGALSGEYLATLPEEVQASVRARLAAKH